MKNIFLLTLLAFLLLLAGCEDEQLTHRETVTNYYKARNASNYIEIKTFLSDSIKMISGDYIMLYDYDSFYKEQFQWDSVFKSSYRIVELEERNNQIIITVSQNNIRNEFLKNNPLMYKQKISFTSEKISKLEELESVGTDWNVWSKERDSLVSWIKINHPELDGFVNDMTINGSMNYLKAIELYKTDKNSR